ncbi:bifunctional ADP-dependent NAD(P)H-hydrate dehydratase/NAD(P)H-hydrate epimerase [Deltaproteobacteria bacterium Smac51]|nr:bifunctional ADP-dependent NAD(P)H-hydrate dehydratase/NAD(P)H-hydrate epimerase [Deltaproteobacteria bacterium Smac51]
MYLATSEEMRQLDCIAINDFGLPGIVLMENAARSIAMAALEFWTEWPESPTVAILAGPGQNGGDGWALARIFSAAGFQVKSYLVMPEGREVKGDAAINLQVARNMGLSVEMIHESSPLPPWEEFDLVVDALFGTGLARPLDGPAAEVLLSAGSARARLGRRLRVLAVDLPSGLSGDTGRMLGPPLPADLTVTLGAPKIGLYLQQGPEMCGHIIVGDIGLTPQMLAKAPPRGRLSGMDEFRQYLPVRPADGHKGTFGHVLLAGGSKGKTGALVLAAMGAAGSGAALISAAHPASLSDIFETKLTEAMTLELPEDGEGQLDAASGSLLLEYARGKQALALGPGLGMGEGAALTVRTVVASSERPPLVLDADGLTHLAGRVESLKGRGDVILTPHPGEAARLLGVDSGAIQSDRLGAAREIADKSGGVVILKGHNSIIAEPGGGFYLNTTGGNHMAVGGSGDLLAGLAAGLLAQGVAPFPAAALAAWVHGRAADIALAEKGPFGLTPSMFADRFPEVWRQLVNNQGLI